MNSIVICLGNNEDNKIAMSCYCKQFPGCGRWFSPYCPSFIGSHSPTSDWYVVVTEDFSFVFFNFANQTLFLLFCIINVSLAIPLCLLFILTISTWSTIFKKSFKRKLVVSKYSFLIYLKVSLFYLHLQKEVSQAEYRILGYVFIFFSIPERYHLTILLLVRSQSWN